MEGEKGGGGNCGHGDLAYECSNRHQVMRLRFLKHGDDEYNTLFFASEPWNGALIEKYIISYLCIQRSSLSYFKEFISACFTQNIKHIDELRILHNDVSMSFN